MRRRLAARLARLDVRIDGPRAATSRTHPVPLAYRTLARQVGLDPDADELLLDTLLFHRLRRGALPSRGPVPDACALATIETGVPVWALDGPTVLGRLRLVVEGDGALAVGDDRGALAPLLGPPVEWAAARPTDADVVLFAVRAANVPAGTVREALWTAAAALEETPA